jgi:hypothetical protein
MAVDYGNASNGSADFGGSAGVGSIQVSTPAFLAVGDLWVITISLDASDHNLPATVINVPAGFLPVSDEWAGGPLADPDAWPFARSMYRIADGTEASVVNVQIGNGALSVYGIRWLSQRFTGPHQTTPIGVVVIGDQAYDAYTVQPSTGPLNIAETGSMVHFAAIGVIDGGGSGNATPPAGSTEVYDQFSNWFGLGAAYEARNAGNYSPGPWSITSDGGASVVKNSRAQAFEIKPGAGAPAAPFERTDVAQFFAPYPHGTGSFLAGPFTPPANSVLIVIVEVMEVGGTSNPVGDLTISDSQFGTWTDVGSVGIATSWSMGLRVWRQEIGSAPTGIYVTVDCGARDVAFYGVTVRAWTGHNVSSPIGALASKSPAATNGAESMTLSGSPVTSSEVYALFMKDATTPDRGVTPGTGWTENFDNFQSGEGTQLQAQFRLGSESQEVSWLDVDAGGVGTTINKSVAFAFEVKAESTVSIAGGFAATESLDTAAFSGTISDVGTLGATESRDASAFSGTMIPSFSSGVLDATERRDAFAATGDANHPDAISGGLAATEQRDTSAFAGVKTFFGTLGATEQKDVAAMSGTIIPSFSTGALAATEARDAYASTGNVNHPGAVEGGLAATESRDTGAFTGAKTFYGTLGATEQRDTSAFSGTLIPSFSTGTLAATEARDVFAATGDAFQPGTIGGSLGATEQRDTAAFSGLKEFFGTLAAAEARDRAAFDGFVFKLISGTMAAAEPRDIALFDGKDLEEGDVQNSIALRDANSGLGISPDQPWRDGAPRNNDGINLPRAIGQAAAPDNFMNIDGVIRQARLVQAISDTPAGAEVIPGWVSNIASKTGEWVWCYSSTVIAGDTDNPIGMPTVIGTV